MYLTQKTERAMKKITKLLDGYELETCGNIIYTPNCTITVRKGEIDVNDQPVSLDDVISFVASVEGR